ncbi:MAG: hypothetical protein LBK73_08705 [Treponema sp.]|jgi:hypothetical protein|nr:hypothetical protein [Treponema sp.]
MPPEPSEFVSPTTPPTAMSKPEKTPFASDEWEISDIKEQITFDDSDPYYHVFNADGRVAVNAYDDMANYTLQVSDGIFVGSANSSEWGAPLAFIPHKGEPYIITRTNLRGLFEIGGEVFCLWGSSWLDRYPHGGIARLFVNEEYWDINNHVELPDEPRAFAIDESDVIYVATLFSLLKVDNEAVATIIAKVPWSPPNSMIITGDSLYIGTLGGVAEYNLDTGETRWWVKKG